MTSAGTVMSESGVGTQGRAAIDDQNPWPGLDYFDEEARCFFNGRLDETAELGRLVLTAPLTVLFAASGLGKTSLLQAGLFPMLREEHFLPVYIRLNVSDRNAPLLDQVNAAFQKQLAVHRVDAPAFETRESLWRYLHRSGLELWSEQNQLLTPLFVFDQFEEVFTRGAENRQAISQLRVDLADLIENRLPRALAGKSEKKAPERAEGKEPLHAGLALESQRYKVLLSFREDYLPHMEGWKRDIPSILRNRLRLLPMKGEQAFEAVHTTASHLVDELTAEKIVRFVARAKRDEELKALTVEPALLSLVCSELNEKRKEQERETQKKAVFDEALLSGNADGIIRVYYEKAVGISDQVQRFIEYQLIDENGFRTQVAKMVAIQTHGVTEAQLSLLVDRWRLLRIEPQRGTEQVELIHDLLTGVVRASRERRRLREAVMRRVKLFGFVAAAFAVAGALWLYYEREQAQVQRAAASEKEKLLEQLKKELKRAEASDARARKEAQLFIEANRAQLDLEAAAADVHTVASDPRDGPGMGEIIEANIDEAKQRENDRTLIAARKSADAWAYLADAYIISPNHIFDASLFDRAALAEVSNCSERTDKPNSRDNPNLNAMFHHSRPPKADATDFADGYFGTKHCVEWKTTKEVSVKSVSLFAAQESSSDDGQRSFSKFELYVKQSDNQWKLVKEYSPSRPYGGTCDRQTCIAPNKSRYSPGTVLAACINIAPTMGQQFRAVFVQASQASYRSPVNAGPRVLQLNGYSQADCQE